MARQCPFDPPRELAEIQAEEPVRRVSLWDGSHPWLVTRHADVRAVLADQRFSADTLLPLDRFPALRVAAAVEDIPFRDTMVVYGVHELPVRW